MVFAVEYSVLQLPFQALAAPSVAVFHNEESNVHHGITCRCLVGRIYSLYPRLTYNLSIFNEISLKKIFFFGSVQSIPAPAPKQTGRVQTCHLLL